MDIAFSILWAMIQFPNDLHSNNSGVNFTVQTISKFLSPKILFRGLGVLILAGILWNLDLAQTWQYLRNVDLVILTYGFALGIPMIVVRAYRWNWIKQSLSINVSVGHSCLYQLIATMSFLTPGRVGEIVKAIYLKSKDFPFTTSVISIVIDRITDLVVIIGTAYIGLFFLSPLSTQMAWGLVLAGFFVILIVALSFRGVIRMILMKIIRIIVPEHISLKIEEVLDRVLGYFSSQSTGWYSAVLGLTVGVFFLQVYRFQVFADALGFTVPFLPLAGVIAIMVTSNLLPISVSGLGTREAVLVFYLTQYGIDAERVLGISAILLLNIVIHATAGSILFTLFPPSLTLDQIISRNGDSEN